MEIIEDKSNRELIQSLLAEVAKSKNELSCAQIDIQKASSRLNFSIVMLNELINRENNK